MTIDTTSEELFVAVCRRQAYTVSKLDTASGRNGRTPDFLVSTPVGDVVVEVKELRPNAEDRRYIQRMMDEHHASHGGTVGARARKAIRDGAAQLKRRCSTQLPMLVVLYDNVKTADGRVGMPMSFTELYHIDAAMYGYTVTHVPLQPGAVATAPDKAGGGRLMTETEKRYVSGVGVLSDWDNATLYVFHNFFASHPLRVDMFADHKCFHYVKAGHPWSAPGKWQKIGGQQPH